MNEKIERKDYLVIILDKYDFEESDSFIIKSEGIKGVLGTLQDFIQFFESELEINSFGIKKEDTSFSLDYEESTLFIKEIKGILRL